MSSETVSTSSRTYIATSLPADLTSAAAYLALPWVRMRGVRVVGDMQSQREVQIESVVGIDYPLVRVGAQKATELTLELIRLPDDEGQQQLLAAFNAGASVSLCVKDCKGDTAYFSAVIGVFSRGGMQRGGLADRKATLTLLAPPINL